MTAIALAWTRQLHYDGAFHRLQPYRSNGRRMRTDPDLEPDVLQAFLDEEEAALETVRRWVAGLVGSRWSFPDPDAVVQEIVLELLRLARDGRIRSDRSFRAFVSTVASHTCVDLYRRQRIRATVETEDGFFEATPDPGPDPEQSARDRERLEHVRFIVQALDPGCQDLLGLFFGEDLAGGEIGRRLGITAGNVRVRVHRCLEKARRIRREFLPEVN